MKDDQQVQANAVASFKVLVHAGVVTTREQMIVLLMELGQPRPIASAKVDALQRHSGITLPG